MATEVRRLPDGSELTLDHDGPLEFSCRIPDWVLEFVARLQPELPEGTAIAVVQWPDQPGVWELVGRRGDEDVCILCGVPIGTETVGLAKVAGEDVKLGPDGDVCSPCVCPACGDHLAGGPSVPS